MVIMLRIGRSAGLLSKTEFDEGYERVSTTERVLVCDDGIVNLNKLKIQSTPTRKSVVFQGMK